MSRLLTGKKTHLQTSVNRPKTSRATWALGIKNRGPYFFRHSDWKENTFAYGGWNGPKTSRANWALGISRGWTTIASTKTPKKGIHHQTCYRSNTFNCAVGGIVLYNFVRHKNTFSVVLLLQLCNFTLRVYYKIRKPTYFNKKGKKSSHY